MNYELAQPAKSERHQVLSKARNLLLAVMRADDSPNYKAMLTRDFRRHCAAYLITFSDIETLIEQQQGEEE